MDKTVIVVAANSLSGISCGQTIALDLSIGKAKSASTTKIISKSLWSCSVEAVTEYCRIVFDLFPDQYQVCVAAVDELKCQPINSWRDEDQDVTKILAGFQKFGPPHFQSQSGPGHTHLSPCLQGMQYAVRCLAQLTASQYAKTVCPGMKTPTNQGRIIFVSTLKSAADVRELEKNMVSMVRNENADIKQKQDTARLPVQFSQLVIINTHAPTVHTSDIKDAPLTSLSSQVSSVVYSFPAKLLLDKCVSLAKLHFNLKSTIVTGIPMKEEQAGGSSANYDVELIHLAEAHRDIMRAGYSLGPTPVSKKDPKDTHSKDSVMLKWSTPKTTSLEIQYCTSAYRVTPAIVTSRPTICLINFVLSGKPVLLEQLRKGAIKVISHVLTSHAGAVFIHSIPSSKSYLEDPPSISEGWGGRITDYRISDFSQVVQENLLFPNPLDRTKIPSVFPIQKAMAKLERETRHWPLVYNDTIVYTLSQDLDPLPQVIRRDSMTDSELEECKGVILSLQAKESANEPLPIPSTGGRTKGVKREEQYRSLWTELENLAEAFSGSSEKHRQLFELIIQATSHSPSMQVTRKTPPHKSESSTPHQTPATTPTVTKDELAWQELDGYQQMTEREKKDYNCGNRNNEHGMWKLKPNGGGLQSQQQQQQQQPKLLPIPAKPVASILSIWTARQRNKANSSHAEFAGRLNYGSRAELYPSLNNSSVVPPVEQDS